MTRVVGFLFKTAMGGVMRFFLRSNKEVQEIHDHHAIIYFTVTLARLGREAALNKRCTRLFLRDVGNVQRFNSHINQLNLPSFGLFIRSLYPKGVTAVTYISFPNTRQLSRQKGL